MRKAFITALITVVMLGAISGTIALAQTYDIGNYMLPQRGWKVWAWNTGEYVCEFATLKNGNYLDVSIWQHQSTKWWLDDLYVEKVLTSEVQTVAYIRRDEVNTFTPAVKVPRSLQLDQWLVLTGIAHVNGSQQVPYSYQMKINQAGLNVTTEAGTFTDCLEISFDISLGDITVATTEYWSPGVGAVKATSDGGETWDEVVANGS